MAEVTQSESKVVFESLAAEWKVAGSAQEILDSFVGFYRNTRIVGARIGDDDFQDMFSIELGPKNELMVYRTIHVENDSPESTEFDDDAFNLTIEMQFHDLPIGTDWISETEISSPAILENKLDTLILNDRLATILKLKPSQIECFVDGAG